MRNFILLMTIISLIVIAGCSEDENPTNILDSTITAKEEIGDILNKAGQDINPDVQLSAIYGRNVATDGTIDLLSPQSNMFVYAVNSASQSTTEFYIPVYGAGPVQSPLDLNTLLGVVQDTTAKNILEGAFGLLSTTGISPAASYADSPNAVSVALQNGGSAFMSQHSDTRIDMYLFPSKSIDQNGLQNSADWIVSFNSANNSLVLWINSNTGIVTTISSGK